LGASIKQVHDGVYRVTTSQSVEFGEVVSKVHCYLIEVSRGRYDLVDTGWARSADETARAIRDALGDEAAIDRLLITHLHPDHYGAARSIAGAFSSKVSYHRKENVHLRSYYNVVRKGRAAAADWLGFPIDVFETVKSAIDASRSLLPRPDSYLAEGERIPSRSGAWRVIHTPGHSPGHTCLYRASDKTLISGDHILPGETPNVAFYPVPGYHALESYLASLAKVKRLEPSAALPGHGNVIRDVPSRVQTISLHHKERLEEVLGGLAGGARSVAEVTSFVKWSRGSYESLGHVNRWLAILETISHLEFLVECGAAERVRGPGRMYRLTGHNWSPVEKAVDRIVNPRIVPHGPS